MSDYIASIFDITLLILGFTIFVLCLLEMKDAIIIKTKFLQKLFQNDDTNPLIDLDAVRNICDEENKFTFLIDSVFEGINGGLYNNYTYSPCTPSDRNCTNIPTIPKHPLKAWDDKALCGKRMDLSNKEFQIINSSSQCPYNFKQCGIYNQFGDKLCLNTVYDCPISFIKFTNSKKEIKDLDTKIYKYITLNMGYFLIYSNLVNSTTIPVDFKISEEYPCLEIERISYNTSFPYYPFINNSNLMGCQTGKKITNKSVYDNRYSIAASDLKANIFSMNDISNRYNKLPNVKGWTDDSMKNYYHIFVRGYISLNYSCTDHETFQDFKLDLENLKLAKFYQLSISLINVVALLIFTSILSLFKLFRSWFKLFIRFVKICLSTLFLMFGYNRIKLTYKLISSLKEYVQIINQCGDDNIISQLETYAVEDNIKELEFIEIIMIYFGVISLATVGILLMCLMFKIYVRFKNRKRREIAKAELGHGSKHFKKELIVSPFQLYVDNEMKKDIDRKVKILN